MIPAYVSPADTPFWNAVVGIGRPVAVVVNPSSGPGVAPRADYRTLIGRLRNSGALVLGYVGTRRGDRPAGDVREEIARWRSWYGVRDILLDEVPVDRGPLAAYRGWAAVVHRQQGLVILNPGALPDRDYFLVADAVITYEGVPGPYVTAPAAPGWLQQLPASRVWNTVNAVSPADLPAVLAARSRHHAGVLYATDEGLPNPYDRLPTYWARETAALVPATSRWAGRPGARRSGYR